MVVLAVKSNSRSPATHPLDSGGSMLVVPLRTPEPIEAMKTRTLEGFGKRLAELRQQRGLTQAELGTAVGVSADVLLGLKPVKDGTSPKTARLLKRLKKVEELPSADQRAVLKLVEALVETRRRTKR